MNSKVELSSANQLPELPATLRNKGESSDVSLTEPAPSAKPVQEDEIIRPFVYRAPVGKSSGSEPSHPKRRSCDVESGGN